MPTLFQINVVSAKLSTGRITNDIASVALQNGWRTYVAYGRSANPGVSQTIKVGGLLNTLLHYVANRLFDCEGLVSRIATRKLIKKISKISPDIVHLHNIHDHYLNYPILLGSLKKMNIPVVWTLHDCWSFTGGCMYYDIHDCRKWTTGCQSCPEKRSLLFDNSRYQYNLKKKLLLDFNNICYVPVSEWLAEDIRLFYKKHNMPMIRTIHNGIDLNVFRCLPKQSIDKIQGQYYILGVAAVWHKRKGLDDFIKLRELLDDTYIITLVGLSESQISQLPKGINAIKRTNSVDGLVSLYNHADVFVNPTYSDNFPTTNIEALACGTPVITYTTGGSPEAIDELTGIVVEQGDLFGLRDAICQLRSNPLSREDCRLRAQSNFNRETCFLEYIDIYNDMLNKES